MPKWTKNLPHMSHKLSSYHPAKTWFATTISSLCNIPIFENYICIYLRICVFYVHMFLWLCANIILFCFRYYNQVIAATTIVGSAAGGAAAAASCQSHKRLTRAHFHAGTAGASSLQQWHRYSAQLHSAW